MVDNLFDGNRISIDLVSSEYGKYRISLFDKNYHFDMDIELDEEQMLELKDALASLQVNSDL